MGIINVLFGNGNKAGTAPAARPESQPVLTAAAVPCAAAAEPVPATELAPEIVAAIAASVYCVLDEERRSVAAALPNAAPTAGGGGGWNAWAFAGRQEIMGSRLRR